MMVDSSYCTVSIREKILDCETVEELKDKILPIIQSQKDGWELKIKEILAEKNCSKTKFAELCGVSRVTVDKWCKGSIPKNRETFLKIGLAAGYDEEKMNHLLMRYGRYPELYSKSLEDCICIYVLNNHYGDEAAQKYQYILEKIKKQIVKEEVASGFENISTVIFDAKISEIQSEDDLEKFVTDNSAIFSTAYRNLYAYILENIKVNYHHFDYAYDEKMDSLKVLKMADIQGWSSSLRGCVSAIRQGKWYPTRNKIISLGLHLSMDHEQIDEMLERAYMEPLYAKNQFESIVMFILEDASLSDLLNKDKSDYNPDDLCNYARKIMKEIDILEVIDFTTELPEGEDE